MIYWLISYWWEKCYFLHAQWKQIGICSIWVAAFSGFGHQGRHPTGKSIYRAEGQTASPGGLPPPPLPPAGATTRLSRGFQGPFKLKIQQCHMHGVGGQVRPGKYQQIHTDINKYFWTIPCQTTIWLFLALSFSALLVPADLPPRGQTHNAFSDFWRRRLFFYYYYFLLLPDLIRVWLPSICVREN